MNIPRPIRYFCAVDLFERALQQESEVYCENGLDPTTVVSGEAGLMAAPEILYIRTAGTLKTTGAIMLRVTGIDALYRVSTQTDFPQ